MLERLMSISSNWRYPDRRNTNVAKVKKARKYTLSNLTTAQVTVLRDALDIYGRLHIGQLMMPLEDVWFARHGGRFAPGRTPEWDVRLQDLRGMLRGLEDGAWRTIGDPPGVERDRPE